jgi:pyridoxamine 5'-phosphate oxidase family protein
MVTAMALMLTPAEIDYLDDQRLGRLATVDADNAPQNNPVGFTVDEVGRVVVGGLDLTRTRKFRNVLQNRNVAFVVDDLASVNPWVVRGVEVRGQAEAIEGVDPPMHGMSRALIRITPRWIASWGLEPGAMRVRHASPDGAHAEGAFQ